VHRPDGRARVVAHQTGNNEKAADLINQAIAIRPDYAEAHGNLGTVLMELGQTDGATESYHKAIDLNPANADPHNNLGTVLKDRGETGEALACFEKAIALNPDYAAAHYNLGNTLNELGRRDEAVESYQTAISLNPGYAAAHNNLGNAFRDAENPAEAEESYRKAIAIRPDYAEAYNNLGNVLRKTGREDEAIECFQKALAIRPDFPSAQHILSALLGNTTDTAPRGYVEDTFDSYAGNFENHLINNLNYQAPRMLRQVFLNLGLGAEKFANAVDLGCGTGLAGAEFRDAAETLVGIDVSRNMIRKAEEKGIYDQLIVDDIVDGLRALDTHFDLFISADTFIYVGNLRPSFEAVSEFSENGAVFLFSTEHVEEGDFLLRKSNRYAQSKDYVLSLADEFGFRLEHFSEAGLRKEGETWIPGGYYVLRKA